MIFLIFQGIYLKVYESIAVIRLSPYWAGISKIPNLIGAGFMTSQGMLFLSWFHRVKKYSFTVLLVAFGLLVIALGTLTFDYAMKSPILYQVFVDMYNLTLSTTVGSLIHGVILPCTYVSFLCFSVLYIIDKLIPRKFKKANDPAQQTCPPPPPKKYSSVALYLNSLLQV